MRNEVLTEMGLALTHVCVPAATSSIPHERLEAGNLYIEYERGLLWAIF